MTVKFNEEEEMWEIKNIIIDVDFDIIDDDIEYNEKEEKELIFKILTKVEKNWDKLNQSIIDSLWKAHNEEWRKEGDPILSEKEFLKKITIYGVEIEILKNSIDEIGEDITIVYEDGDLFWGHHIVLEWDSDGKISEAYLFG